jgi:pimeloyl-ACP methyl ester carboxylesterase
MPLLFSATTLRIATALALLFSGTASPAAAPEANEPPAGRPQWSDCRLQHPDRLQSIGARCAAIEVPENPSDARGARIQLHVAVVPALNRRAVADPVFVLAGGPGQAATDFYAAVAPAFVRVHRDRDIVLLDQRGTGLSNALNCDYPEDEELAELGPEEIRAATKRCLEQIHGNPVFYTTSIAVRDLDTVRRALGYGRINLYGISYGTRVAQHYARRYPASVRSIVLDGVVPPQQILGIDTSLHAQRALDRIFERCRAEKPCAAAFADPAAAFRQLLSDLQKGPAEVAFPDPINGTVLRQPFRMAHLQAAVRLLSYSPDRAALLPLLLEEGAHKHDLAPLAAQARMVSDRISEALSYGMHNSVVCSEDAPFFATSAVDRRALEATYLGTAQLDGLIEICSVWPRGPVDPDFHEPLASEVPVLLLSGTADPVTPPEYAERARVALKRALHLTLVGQGHGQLGVGCMPKVIAAFYSAGTSTGLDTSCVRNTAPPPFFISFTGPPP